MLYKLNYFMIANIVICFLKYLAHDIKNYWILEIFGGKYIIVGFIRSSNNTGIL